MEEDWEWMQEGDRWERHCCHWGDFSIGLCLLCLDDWKPALYLGQQFANHHLSLAPYERRVIELLRNSKDKRARKLAKKRVRRSDTHRHTHNTRSRLTLDNSSVPSAVPRRRSTSSSASSPRLAARVTKSSNLIFGNLAPKGFAWIGVVTI